MKSIQARVDESVDEFIGKLEKFVGEYAVEAIDQRLGKRVPPRRGQRVRTAYRPPNEISALWERLHARICRRPGETMMVLSQALGHSSAALALPARKLVQADKVRKTGHNAMTRYFPVGGPPPKGGPKKRQGSQRLRGGRK